MHYNHAQPVLYISLVNLFRKIYTSNVLYGLFILYLSAIMYNKIIIWEYPLIDLLYSNQDMNYIVSIHVMAAFVLKMHI